MVLIERFGSREIRKDLPMTRLVSLGLFGLLGALAFSACSSDEDDGPSAGSGGTAGAGGGNAGTGGAAGGGAGGAAGGGSGGGGAGGSGQQGAACPGCVRLDLPFTAENQSANYQFNLTTPVDFSTTVVTVRFRVNSFAGNAGGIQLYVQNGAPGFEAYGFEFYRNIGAASTDFQTVTLDLNAIGVPVDPDAGVPDAGPVVVVDAGGGDAGDAGPGIVVPANGFNKTLVSIIGFQVTSGGTFTGANFGTAQIDVDSITFAPAGVTPDRTFDTEADFTAFAGVGTPLGTKTYVAP
jgi:hypothetical protein